MAYNLNRKTREFIPEWKDNKKNANPIKLELKTLLVEDYCELLDIAQRSSTNIENKKIKDFTIIGQLAKRLVPIFKTNITKISNLTIDNRSIKAEELALYAEFVELNSEITNEMIIRATLSDTDKKK